jgi:hypothetical protein
MIARATAIKLISRNIGRRYNAVELGDKPVISFTMTERKRREIAKLIENEQHLPTCLELFGIQHAARHGRTRMTFTSCTLSTAGSPGGAIKGGSD